MEAVNGSLERLQTVYIDVYLFHRYFAGTPLETAVTAMDTVVRSGLARAGGASNFSFEQLQCALEISRRNGLRPFQVVENNYNLAVPGVAGDILPLTRREQIGVLTYSPLGAGFLTGTYWWVLQNPDVDTVLVGARTIGHLENAVEAARLELGPEIYTEMNAWN